MHRIGAERFVPHIHKIVTVTLSRSARNSEPRTARVGSVWVRLGVHPPCLELLDGTYFDVTAEQFLNWTPDLTIYVMTLAISAEEAQALWKQRSGCECYGGEMLSGVYWRNYVENSTEVTRS